MKKHNRITSFFQRDAFALAAALAFSLGYFAARQQPRPSLCTAADLTTAPDAVFAQAQQASAEDVRLVCLTFDDGPSKNTAKVLDILAEKQVPATFFVVASDHNSNYLPLIARQQSEGHQVALHSCTHDYSQIYQNPQAYWNDIEALKQRLSAYVDADGIRYLRFPGGSTNTVSRRYGGSGIMKQLKAQAEEKGYHWVDWNVCAEDAAGGKPSAERIYQNVIQDAADQSVCVVLMHDTAATGNTVEALPQIIDWFRENQYTFCTVQEVYP